MERERREQRLAENEATFREANERIEETAQMLEVSGLVPFVCECGDECLYGDRAAEARRVRVGRAHPRMFLILPAHERTAAITGRVVQREERFLVAKKMGRAGAVAEEADPRTARGQV